MQKSVLLTISIRISSLSRLNNRYSVIQTKTEADAKRCWIRAEQRRRFYTVAKA